MLPVSLMLVFFCKLINTLVILVQRLRPEFRTLHSIMRQILVTKTTDNDSIRDTHYVVNIYF